MALHAASDEGGQHRQEPSRRRLIGWRGLSLIGLLIAYAIVTALVLIPNTPLLRLDSYLKHLDLWYRYPGWRTAISDYVMLGQRGPATLAFLPFFLWVAWRQRSSRPLVVLVTALLWLNFSVGVVKYVWGRVGPMHSDDVHKLFDFGNSIYPSGHVSNAVVLYGLIAWLAPKYRKTLTVAAVVLSTTVGLATVYLRTHWFSDVVGGWIAGGLVLLTLPYLLPTAQRWADAVEAWLRAWWTSRHQAAPSLVRYATTLPAPPLPAPPLSAPQPPPARAQRSASPLSSSASRS